MTIEKLSRFNTTRRMRLQGYDYRASGYYFLTCCQRDRLPLFVNEANGNWQPTGSGGMVTHAITELELRFSDLRLDSYVVMPNHLHLLIGLSVTQDSHSNDSVVDAMHWLKTVTTNRYIKGVKTSGWPRFNAQLWQEGYHDRIVRNDRELESIRNYIRENPMRWREDEFYEDESD